MSEHRTSGERKGAARGTGKSLSRDEELAWLILAGVGLAGLVYLWRERLRPWLADADLPLVKVKQSGGIEVDRAELVPVVMLAAAVLLTCLALRSALRRPRGRDASQGEAD